ncbi:MAG: 4Fe-4S dicluster domain-containing protein [Alphaproteobacteria bacterium]|nr:MAG: 4Fe-4S dicluster domain-containing protein [Alphaproteobacteria bacterium]
MQTNFTPEQLQDPHIAVANQILRKCVHCGFCTATCPTYVLLGDELDSPRGRIYLIKNMLERGEAATSETVKHIDRCLSCLACRRPLFERLLRDLLAFLMTRPALFRTALGLSRLAQPLAPVLEKLGEKHFKAMLELAPKVPPEPETMGRPGVYPAQGKTRMRVALLRGCVQSILDPAINAAAIRLMNRNGIEVVVSEGETCCGSLTHHMGKEADALARARRMIDGWREANVERVIITASGCGTTVKDYGHMLRLDPAYAGKAERISAMTREISEFLIEIGLPKIVPPRALRVAYHSACSMQHGQKIRTEPRRLLEQAGFEVTDIPEGHLCCGSAGTYNILQPEIATRLRDRKIANINSVTPAVIATGNIGCITQIGQATEIPILHTVELLDWAHGGYEPRVLRESSKG